MLKMACCPSFKWSSFIIYITIVDVVVYLITLITGCCSGGFLGPTTSTLKTWGSLVRYRSDLSIHMECDMKDKYIDL